MAVCDLKLMVKRESHSTPKKAAADRGRATLCQQPLFFCVVVS